MYKKRRLRLAIISIFTVYALLGGWATDPHAAATGDDDIQTARPARRALLIGIGKYDDRHFPPLEYPRNDVTDLTKLLESPGYGFTVTRLTDWDASTQRPTRENILKAIKKYLIDDAAPGDICLFYYSGHGSSIKNSLSDEADLRDETIVPIDAVRPVTSKDGLKDIRDKELTEIFNLALAKKVVLTAIFDSCHSGSISRGDEQSKEVEGIDLDIKTPVAPSQMSKPEEHGALIMSATRDYQTASGNTYEELGGAKYSHFTANLLLSLYRRPGYLVSAGDLFEEIGARITSDGRTMQTPTIAGLPFRLEQTIFGDATQKTDGRARVFVTTDQASGEQYLTGGIANGLSDGVELKRISTGPASQPTVRLRITKAGLTSSAFEVLVPQQKVNNNDQFEQTTWVTKAQPNLRVWLPPATLTDVDLAQAIVELKKLPAERIAAEPTDVGVLELIYPAETRGVASWKIGLSSRMAEDLGPSLTAQTITARLDKAGAAKVRAFIDLPPSAALRQAIVQGLANNEGGVAITTDRDAANYELVGRLNAATGAVEYAWMLRSAMTGENDKVKSDLKEPAAPASSMPRLTDWTVGDASAMPSIKRLALKLSNIRGLVKLASPMAVGTARFPYRLEIRNMETKRRLAYGDVLKFGETYEAVLVKTRESAEMMATFSAYLMDIDANGKSQSIGFDFGPGMGDKDRQFDAQSPPDEISLVKGFSLDPAENADPAKRGVFGSETFILLVTDKKLEAAGALDFSGVRNSTNAGTKGNDPFNPLKDLLTNLGSGTNAKGSFTPDTWLVQQLVLRSVQ